MRVIRGYEYMYRFVPPLYIGRDVRMVRTNDCIVNRSLLDLPGVVGCNYLCTTVQLISSNACTMPNWIAYVAASTSVGVCARVRARGMRWTTRLLCVPLVRLSWEAEISLATTTRRAKCSDSECRSFYVDSAPMNSRWCSRILKKREIKRAVRDAMPF